MQLNAPFLVDNNAQRIIGIINDGGGAARFVGGCVRNAILGGQVTDIDLAANLPPDTVMRLLTAAGVTLKPTGIAHGTVTAIIDHTPYEITSLRSDVATDGRHATVAFTDDWQQDAQRRDFTMNALYADADGTLYDYVGGTADAAARCVRFVGDPATRIAEDYLRILRFYRFYAQYGAGELDAAARRACRELCGGLAQLSAERIQQELKKLLMAPQYAPACRFINEDQIFADLLPQLHTLAGLERLVSRETAFYPASWLARLVAWCHGNFKAAFDIADYLKFSNADKDYLKSLANIYSEIIKKPLRELLYRHGVPLVKDALLLNQKTDLAIAMTVIENWQPPIFPLSGKDLLAQGITPGPQLGTLLKQVESWWIAQDFAPDRAACLDYAKRLVS